MEEPIYFSPETDQSIFNIILCHGCTGLWGDTHSGICDMQSFHSCIHVHMAAK